MDAVDAVEAFEVLRESAAEVEVDADASVVVSPTWGKVKDEGGYEGVGL
jgi:hypothetical protein